MAEVDQTGETPPLYCPKCDRSLGDGELYCPVDHSIGGGVHGLSRTAIEGTPRSKRHLLGLTINDAYIINGFLGAGGFGAVYRAEQKALARDVALKLLMVDTVNDPAVISRFKREARTAAQLLDPNIVTLFDYGEATISEDEDDRVLFFAMELVHGPTLRQIIKAEKGLGLEASVTCGVNILRGLAAAHQLGVVHRDLKPGNVLLDESKNRHWFARLFDFGISSLAGSGGHTTQMGQGGVLGTPKYMAPEQWRAKQTAPCTDMYAFGVMLCEMLTGEPPVPKMEVVDMATAHCKKPRPEITETSRGEPVPLALTNFIKKCMAIDPRQRYGTAREALDALEKIASEGEAAPVPEVSKYDPSIPRDTDPSASAFSGHVQPSAGPPPLPPPLTGEHLAVKPPLPPPPRRDDESDVIKVELEEPRRIWPWVLAAVGLALVFVGFRLVDALSKRGEMAAPAAASPAVTAPPPAKQVDAAPVVEAAPDAAPVVKAAPDAAPVVKATPDAAPVAVLEPDAAVAEPGKPKPAKKWVPRPKVAKKPDEAPPEETPKPKKIAGLDVTPMANPTSADIAAAEANYVRGVDAQGRGAPKSAQRFFVKALRQGLKGPKAADAQRRIKQIADAQALEASEF